MTGFCWCTETWWAAKGAFPLFGTHIVMDCPNCGATIEVRP